MSREITREGQIGSQRRVPIELESHFLRTSRSEEHTSELQSQSNLVCRLLLEKKKERTLRARPEPRPRQRRAHRARRRSSAAAHAARRAWRRVHHRQPAVLLAGAVWTRFSQR